MSTAIATDFPFKSHFVNVHGAKMHYVDEGEGDPLVFIHGIPTSSYLWRNIIPALSNQARCIALDLIGMGQSDKPDIDYTVFDHIHYLEGFISALDLKNVTFMLHAWGSVIGFDYAMRNEENVKALAFTEAQLRPAVNPEMVALPMHELAAVLGQEDGGYDVVMNTDYYIDKIFPGTIVRRLSPEELAYYHAPFSKPGSRKPIWQFLQDLPLGKQRTDVVALIERYSQKLTQSQLPKLMFYAVPGFNTTIETVKWAKDHLPHLTQIAVEDALHYPQESNPQVISEALSEWYSNLVIESA
ncbi:MAG: haloalkane dehalogenase [Gammaproteobacteria bacterium]